MITMIDYGASNIRSAQKAFEYIGATVILTEDPEVVRRADKLVLPGVGAFGSGMDGLRQRHLPAAIHEAVRRGVPFLGICVGMQLMFSEGHEMGVYQGLDLMAGKVVRFPEKLSMVNGQSSIVNGPIRNPQSAISKFPTWAGTSLSRRGKTRCWRACRWAITPILCIRIIVTWRR